MLDISFQLSAVSYQPSAFRRSSDQIPDEPHGSPLEAGS
jgi:hypothetical protein